MSDFSRIDRIRSVSKMRDAVARLPPKKRKAVILEALAKSSHQFSWSLLAKDFGVPESEWPPAERTVTLLNLFGRGGAEAVVTPAAVEKRAILKLEREGLLHVRKTAGLSRRCSGWWYITPTLLGKMATDAACHQYIASLPRSAVRAAARIQAGAGTEADIIECMTLKLATTSAGAVFLTRLGKLAVQLHSQEEVDRPNTV